MTRFAKARRVAGVMNKLEQEYERLFLGKKPHGYEQITLKLADDCRYTPDFWVQEDDDTITLVEVKGFWRDGSKEKVRIAAKQFPMFRFHAWSKAKGVWMRERFGQEDAA